MAICYKETKRYKYILVVGTILSTILFFLPYNSANAFDFKRDLCVWCEKSLSDYKEILKDKNLSLGEKNKEVSEEYKKGVRTLFTFSSILKKSKNENEAFGSVHDKWENVESAVRDLNDVFKSLVKSADDLFRFATEKANSISDSNLKNSSLRKIESNKSKYTEKLVVSKKNLDRLGELNVRVKDRITALEISYTLDTLDNEITKAFSGIDENVSKIIEALKILEKETDELLGNL